MQMEACTRGNFLITKPMARGSTLTRISISTPGTGKMTSSKAWAKLSMKMDKNIKDNSEKDLNMGRDKYILMMAPDLKAILKTTISSTMENTTNLMIAATREIGRRIRCMAREN